MTDRRCETCRHWEQYGSHPQGRCAAITFRSHDRRAVIDLQGQGDVTVDLDTDADFGCVEHSSNLASALGLPPGTTEVLLTGEDQTKP